MASDLENSRSTRDRVIELHNTTDTKEKLHSNMAAKQTEFMKEIFQ